MNRTALEKGYKKKKVWRITALFIVNRIFWVGAKVHSVSKHIFVSLVFWLAGKFRKPCSVRSIKESLVFIAVKFATYKKTTKK